MPKKKIMQHGGKRSNAGRKPVKDKAMQVNIYPRTSVIRKVGGLKKAKELALNALILAAEKS